MIAPLMDGQLPHGAEIAATSVAIALTGDGRFSLDALPGLILYSAHGDCLLAAGIAGGIIRLAQ